MSVKIDGIPLGELLGEVSTCWDEEGVFKSERVNEIQDIIENRIIQAEKVIEFYADEKTQYSAGLEMNTNVSSRDGSEDGYVMDGGFLAREYQQKYMSEDSDE